MYNFKFNSKDQNKTKGKPRSRKVSPLRQQKTEGFQDNSFNKERSKKKEISFILRQDTSKIYKNEFKIKNH